MQEFYFYVYFALIAQVRRKWEIIIEILKILIENCIQHRVYGLWLKLALVDRAHLTSPVRAYVRAIIMIADVPVRRILQETTDENFCKKCISILTFFARLHN